MNGSHAGIHRIYAHAFTFQRFVERNEVAPYSDGTARRDQSCTHYVNAACAPDPDNHGLPALKYLILEFDYAPCLERIPCKKTKTAG